MSRLYTSFKKYHKWLGLILAVFFIMFALSGIVMNHRGFFSRFDVNRNWLPKEYRYKNWNNAAVRGATSISNDSLLVYGNIGIWLTDNNLSSFSDFNKGFPKGIDNRKISDLIQTNDGKLFAATLFGLFKFDEQNRLWTKIDLPIKEKRIVALEQVGDSLIVVSRSYVLIANKSDDYKSFSLANIPAPRGAEKRVSLFKTIWVIHSGEIYGLAGKIIVDIGGIAMILLSITGLIYFFAPKLLKRIKTKVDLKSRIKSVNKWSYKWHLKVGIIVAFLLLIVSVTGMFLRPPLLIPIASKTVKPIKGSHLDNSNYWDDKLRDIIFDPNRNIFLLSTSDGFYFLPKNLNHEPIVWHMQPPVSIMGINVLWCEKDGSYAVGSFSGLYKWNPYYNYLSDYLTGVSTEVQSGIRSPFGNMPIAGGIALPSGEKIFFDYNQGAFSLNQGLAIPPMPQEIIEKSGMSLWNLALEVHTWRILNFIIGMFYILVVPISGIIGLILVITGTVMWLIRNNKRKSRIADTQ
jgi:hypothetical protein